ncbi:ATP-binding protein [Phenylobacterium sp.]|uniref:hybrid sensor histidine kinase/response regulator n=1 Tax=Phenylobacterium sp. TaxID=1871053 RepID=UPI002732796F|nr:ATP-binding protein [Phenylobacterium sp.]MDP3852338.1 ATP-binding protein [Phenylobacterium sp.]
MTSLLDDGLDGLAASVHQAIPLRMIIAVIVAAVGAAALPIWLCTLWGSAVVAGEIWAYFTTRRQFAGEKARPGLRLNYTLCLAIVTCIWIAFGGALWSLGRTEASVAAVAVWLAVIYHAQTHAYQSHMGLIAGGAIPAVLMLAILAFAPNPLALDLGFILPFMVLGLLFSGDGAARMIQARGRFNEAQRDLAQSDAQYRMLADNLTDVIALSGLDGRRIYVSPSIETAMGYTAKELFGTPTYTFLHPEDAVWLPQAIADMAAGPGKVTLEYRVVHKEGRVIWVETTFCLVANDDPDAPPQVVSVSRDIDTRKQMETELVVARRRAEEAAAAKSDFLANMTHELRTPLNAIIGFSGVLAASPRLTGDDARHVGVIHDASGSLLELVNSVLDFSKLEAGAVEVEARPFDPAAPARTMADLLGEQAEAKGLALSIHMEGAIAPLLGDAGRIRQVLVNFVSNAIKFTAQGAVDVTVRQTEAPGDCGRLRIEVSDTGIGLRDDQIEHLFERFTQADASVSRRYGGTGLGLAICKRTVELMGGTLGASSKPGVGSTFWFELVLPRTDQPVVSDTRAPVPEGLERPLRLLLVEDVAVNRELIAALLGPFSVEIETAENGQEAVEAMRQRAFDIVLMDIQMPVMDGLTATQAIRALPLARARSTPIIAMTANVLPEQIARCHEAGMDDHLGKPIEPTKLLEALAAWSSPQDLDEAEAADERTG